MQYSHVLRMLWVYIGSFAGHLIINKQLSQPGACYVVVSTCGKKCQRQIGYIAHKMLCKTVR